MTASTKTEQGAAQFTHGGKWHPATRYTGIDGKSTSIICFCGCPGTSQGAVYHSARFKVDAPRTCRVKVPS
jgi:hypothetical protein